MKKPAKKLSAAEAEKFWTFTNALRYVRRGEERVLQQEMFNTATDETKWRDVRMVEEGE